MRCVCAWNDATARENLDQKVDPTNAREKKSTTTARPTKRSDTRRRATRDGRLDRSRPGRARAGKMARTNKRGQTLRSRDALVPSSASGLRVIYYGYKLCAQILNAHRVRRGLCVRRDTATRRGGVGA